MGEGELMVGGTGCRYDARVRWCDTDAARTTTGQSKMYSGEIP